MLFLRATSPGSQTYGSRPRSRLHLRGVPGAMPGDFTRSSAILAQSSRAGLAPAGGHCRAPLRAITIELEQKQQDQTLMLRELQLYQQHFELHYVWIRPPFTAGFAFVPRIIFHLSDNAGNQWAGDRGGMLFARSELSSNSDLAFYQGYARFSPLLPLDARQLTIRAADPLGQFEQSPLHPWQFEITL